MEVPQASEKHGVDVALRRHVLSDSRLFGQSIANVAPTVGALALIPLAFAEAANGAWLTAVLATVGILAVGTNIAVLARRYVTAGALYNFVPQGLGRWSGFLVAVTLIGLVVIGGPFFAIGFGQAFAGFLAAVGVYHAGAGGCSSSKSSSLWRELRWHTSISGCPRRFFL